MSARVLAVGQDAPDFTLRDQNNQQVMLSSFRAAKNVLLVFFPLAFTSICARELDEIRDRMADFVNDDTATLAISVGPSPTHKVWATERGFTFPVLADFWPHGAVSQAYGVFNDELGFRQPGDVRGGPLGRHQVRRVQTARRGPRSRRVVTGADRSAVGLSRLCAHGGIPAVSSPYPHTGRRDPSS